MSDEIQTFDMAESQCRSGQDPLISFLQEARNAPVQIRAQAVENLGAMRLQILLSARNKWRDEQIEFEVTDISNGFQKGLMLFGLSENEFGEVAIK